MNRLGSFGKELFRRKVVRVVIAYLAVFWGVVLALANLQDTFDYSPLVTQIFMIIGILAIPLVAYLAWRYDIVPPQLIRDIKDVEAENPALSWARIRHETKDAGYVLLAWTGGDGSKLEKRFFQPVSIGREMNNDIELPDERVSRHHAVLWAENGIWHIRDLDSANGTFVGHSRVAGTLQLPQSCDLRFHVNGPIISVHIAKSAATRVG
jgi:FHA domain